MITLSDYIYDYPHLVLSPDIQISEKELLEILENNTDTINEAIYEIYENEIKEISVTLNNAKTINIIIDKKKVHLYYKVNEIEKNKKFISLLDKMCDEIKTENEEEKELKNKLLEKGIVTPNINHILNDDKACWIQNRVLKSHYYE